MSGSPLLYVPLSGEEDAEQAKPRSEWPAREPEAVRLSYKPTPPSGPPARDRDARPGRSERKRPRPKRAASDKRG